MAAKTKKMAANKTAPKKMACDKEMPKKMAKKTNNKK